MNGQLQASNIVEQVKCMARIASHIFKDFDAPFSSVLVMMNPNLEAVESNISMAVMAHNQLKRPLQNLAYQDCQYGHSVPDQFLQQLGATINHHLVPLPLAFQDWIV